MWGRCMPLHRFFSIGQTPYVGFVLVATEADYVGFVKYAAMHEGTPVFEYIGRRSDKKEYEGGMHRVVLVVVRFHGSASGGCWLGWKWCSRGWRRTCREDSTIQ